ncbi:conserved hypothetical protein [Methylobacterium nodulans ORS 2060]|uniref:Uncharacterized protein n=1 Tax=Methylobacterium nodulans (strain LMG 21967 / CNCM I-2342 / ORS 2060) TaxID=460265 RepID=B8IMA7_METNO|nr:conserved hypothetical protein [Methylobacterium nodulans ORS 2060]
MSRRAAPNRLRMLASSLTISPFELVVTKHHFLDATGIGRIDESADPLLHRLTARGLVRPRPFRLGLDVGPDYRVRGVRPGRLWTLGPLLRGAPWECLAAPDIRNQAVEVAALIGAEVDAAPDLRRAPAFARRALSRFRWGTSGRASGTKPLRFGMATRGRLSASSSASFGSRQFRWRSSGSRRRRARSSLPAMPPVEPGQAITRTNVTSPLGRSRARAGTPPRHSGRAHHLRGHGLRLG